MGKFSVRKCGGTWLLVRDGKVLQSYFSRREAEEARDEYNEDVSTLTATPK